KESRRAIPRDTSGMKDKVRFSRPMRLLQASRDCPKAAPMATLVIHGLVHNKMECCKKMCALAGMLFLFLICRPYGQNQPPGVAKDNTVALTLDQAVEFALS